MPSPVLAVATAALTLTAAVGPAATDAFQSASLIPRPPRVGKPRGAAPARPAKATPKPTATPKARPTAAPTIAPTAPTPSPEAGAEGPPAVDALPAAEGHLGTWVLPLGGGAGYDFGLTKAALAGGGSLWWGDWGLGAEATVFNAVYASFQATPYFQANTWMTEATVKRRFNRGRYELFGGYRGIGQGDVNFALVGFGLDRPIAADWLSLTGHARYGTSFSGNYVFDGDLGLSADFDPLRLQLGFRHLAVQAGGLPLFQINGPTAGIALRF